MKHCVILFVTSCFYCSLKRGRVETLCYMVCYIEILWFICTYFSHGRTPCYRVLPCMLACNPKTLYKPDRRVTCSIAFAHEIAWCAMLSLDCLWFCDMLRTDANEGARLSCGRLPHMRSVPVFIGRKTTSLRSIGFVSLNNMRTTLGTTLHF